MIRACIYGRVTRNGRRRAPAPVRPMTAPVPSDQFNVVNNTAPIDAAGSKP